MHSRRSVDSGGTSGGLFGGFEDVGDAAFFADGVHDDLVTLLSKLADIRVIARTSVERYRNTDQGIREIADVLGVSTILEGGVRLAGDSVRINVQLVDAATEFGHL